MADVDYFECLLVAKLFKRCFWGAAISLALLAFDGPVALSQLRPVVDESGDVLQRGLQRSQAHSSPALRPTCVAEVSQWAGLTLRGRKVINASLLGDIGGYAQEAGTSGGLGGELRIVTSNQDYDTRTGEKPIPGSLRAVLNSRPDEPRWIVFALPKGTSITLKDVLRIPDNVTIDGTCSGVTIQAPPRTPLIYVFDRRNIIITRLAFQQTDYVPGRNDDKGQTCLRLNGRVDAVAIVNNDIRRCGDGLLDITVSASKPMPERARITVSYNHFAEHDKVMLFGTFTCGPSSRENTPCDSRDLEHNRRTGPSLFLTLNGNLFEGTVQRHPRVFGQVMAHIVNNVIAYRSYGTFVSNGARALIQGNVYLMTGSPNSLPRAVWTTTTPGSMRMPADVEGFIRAPDNRSPGPSIFGENEPDLVPTPPYSSPPSLPTFARLPLEEAIACIAARVGPDGMTGWPSACR